MCNPMFFFLPVLVLFALVSELFPDALGLLFILLSLTPFGMVFYKPKPACQDGNCGD